MAVNQVTWNWVVNGQAINNVQYYDMPATDPFVRQDFADSLRLAVDTHIRPFLSPDCVLNSVSMRELDGGPAVAFDVPFGLGPLAGSASGQLFDLTSPLQVYYRSQTAKPNRGWIKFSGLTESGWAGTSWEANVITGFTNLFTGLTSGFPVSGGTAILGICRPDFPTNSVFAFNLISSFVVRPYTRKQTSRRPQD